MRSSTLRLARSAVPLGVLGGTALLATAVVLHRRARRADRAPARATPEKPDLELGEAPLLEPDEPSFEPMETPTELHLGSDLEARAGESYDSVSPDDAPAEWLLRATESQAPPHRETEAPIEALLRDEADVEFSEEPDDPPLDVDLEPMANQPEPEKRD